MDIVHELIARATPDRVYQVLTEQEHLAAWYCPDTQAEPRVGSIAEFRFDRGVIRVQIAELVPDQKVVWKVLQGLLGWEGVTGDITWLLTTPFAPNTMVHRTHTGWPSMDGPYPSVNFKSAWFLTRMKSYVETGVASPS